MRYGAQFLVMFIVGITLSFGGTAIAAFLALRMFAVERVAALAAIALLTLVGSSLDGAILLLIIEGILLLGLVAEQLRIAPQRRDPGRRNRVDQRLELAARFASGIATAAR